MKDSPKQVLCQVRHNRHNFLSADFALLASRLKYSNISMDV
jgi:hypothetical protein